MVRYAFTVRDSHPLLLAGLPAHIGFVLQNFRRLQSVVVIYQVLLSFERAQTAVAKSRGASLVSVKLYQFRQGPSHRLGQTIRFR